MVEAPRRRSVSEGTRTRLLAAAQKLFLDQGYESTTVRNIAQEASVTIGAFYGHYESKRAVLFEVVRTLNVASQRRQNPFTNQDQRSLVLTIASFAHTDAQAAVVLGEVLRGSGPQGVLDHELAAAMLTDLAR